MSYDWTIGEQVRVTNGANKGRTGRVISKSGWRGDMFDIRVSVEFDGTLEDMALHDLDVINPECPENLERIE